LNSENNQTQVDILLYDLTSTYFERDPPEDYKDMRRFGYSRDNRSACRPPMDEPSSCPDIPKPTPISCCC